MRTRRGLSRRSHLPSAHFVPHNFQYGRRTRCGDSENTLKFVRKWHFIRDDRDSDHYSSLGPPASQNVGGGCVDPLFCVPILAQKIASYSPQISESQGSPSGLRVQVSGMYLNPDSLISDKR